MPAAVASTATGRKTRAIIGSSDAIPRPRRKENG
jgi:hypothetical protein